MYGKSYLFGAAMALVCCMALGLPSIASASPVNKIGIGKSYCPVATAPLVAFIGCSGMSSGLDRPPIVVGHRLVKQKNIGVASVARYASGSGSRLGGNGMFMIGALDGGTFVGPITT